MRFTQTGFALPTILISSVVLLIVLVSAVSAAASVNAALDRDFYKQLAREAAESGVVRALDCLKGNGYVEQWSGSSYLRPGNNTVAPCTGTSTSAFETCKAAGTCLLIPASATNRSQYRTYFSVRVPSNEGDSQRVLSEGVVERLRPDGSVAETINVFASLRVPKSTSVGTVESIIFGE